jgi:hypothetical protein
MKSQSLSNRDTSQSPAVHKADRGQALLKILNSLGARGGPAIRLTGVRIKSRQQDRSLPFRKGSLVDKETCSGTGRPGDRRHLSCGNGSDRHPARGLSHCGLSTASRSGLGSKIPPARRGRPARAGHRHKHLRNDSYWNDHGCSRQMVDARGSGCLACRCSCWLRTASSSDGYTRWPFSGTEVDHQLICRTGVSGYASLR